MYEQGGDLRDSIDQVGTRGRRVHRVGWARMPPLCTSSQQGMALWVEIHKIQ